MLACFYEFILVVSVQSLSRVWLFATPWTTACQASLSFTISWSLIKLMPIESVMPSNHLILCHPLLLLLSTFPSIRSLLVSQPFASGGQSIEASASASVLSMNIQDWFPLGLTGLTLLSRGLSKVCFNTTVQKQQFFGAQPSFSKTILLIILWQYFRLPWLLRDKEFAYQCRRCGFNPWVEKFPWKRKW